MDVLIALKSRRGPIFLKNCFICLWNTYKPFILFIELTPDEDFRIFGWGLRYDFRVFLTPFINVADIIYYKVFIMFVISTTWISMGGHRGLWGGVSEGLTCRQTFLISFLLFFNPGYFFGAFDFPFSTFSIESKQLTR